MEIGVKNKIFTKTSTSDAHLYSNQDLWKLLVPIIVEQLLSSLMGTADTMMVSNVGSAAISAVDRKSTRLNSSHNRESRMPSSA